MNSARVSRRMVRWLVGGVLANLILAGGSHARELTSESRVDWQVDYVTARDRARQQQTLLFIQFVEPELGDVALRWRSELDADAAVAAKLRNLVCLHLSTSATAPISGKETVLLEHGAFREMRGRSGVAIIDMRELSGPNYHRVVSVLPGDGAGSARAQPFPRRDDLAVLLDLPDGSLTQRTLIYAVRTHPDRPQSTAGEWHPVLVEESQRHAQYQAEIGVQGHHAWEQRFHRINARLPENAVAQEVCAESWSGQGLIAAARECVHSWRQSSGHWGAVSSRHRFFGYDMQRGNNGVWYATGIFGRHR